MPFLLAAAATLSLLAIDGTAQTADGRPASGAQVCAIPDPMPHEMDAPTGCAPAGPSGAFHLEVPPGTYMVSAVGPDGASALARKADGSAPVALTLHREGRPVTGRVLDPRGKPVPKAWVFVVRVTRDLDPEAFTMATDAKGRFQLTAGEGPLFVGASSGPDLQSEMASAGESGAAALDLRLWPKAKGPAPQDVIAWIRKTAIPLATVQAGNGFKDMEPLVPIIGDARVVALGEATHGTKEFFQLKHRMLEFLVRRMGFTVFGIEASLPDALAVNEYVENGKGDPASALAGLGFWTWNTEEVLAMIRWMRQYNEDPGNLRKIRFVGFDMQAPGSSADRLSTYLALVTPQDEVRKLIDPLDPLTVRATEEKPSQAQQATVKAAIAALDAHLEEHQAALVQASSPAAYALARHLVELLRQAQEMFWSPAFSARDRAMADNVRWYLAQEPPGTRMVLWAHNGHITFDPQTQADGAMGAHLRRALGPDYLAFGFAFDHGAFQAVEKAKGLHPMSVGPAKEESLDAALMAASPGPFALDLRRLRSNGSVADWFRIPRPVRSIGAIFEPGSEDGYYGTQSVPRAYDALLFVGTTTSAVPVAQARPSRPARALPEKPSNLDFEAESVEGAPPGWFSPTVEGGYRVTVEEAAPAEGKRCVRLDREGDRRKSMPFGNLMQSINAVALRGKKVRFKASVRSEVEGSSTAQLWMRVDREGTERGFFDNMQDRPIRDPEWKPYEIVGEVAEDATSLNFGLILVGTGRVWIDDVHVGAVEEGP